MRKRLFKLSAITFVISIVVLIIAYLVFHYITDSGITLIKQEEAQKPFITGLIGQFGVLFMFTSVLSLIIALLTPKDKE